MGVLRAEVNRFRFTFANWMFIESARRHPYHDPLADRDGRAYQAGFGYFSGGGMAPVRSVMRP